MLHLSITDAKASSENIFRLCSQVVMEKFEDGALLLRLEDRHLFDLNPTAYCVLKKTDGRRNAAQVADAVAETCQVTGAEALQDTILLYAQLSNQGLIEMVKPHQDGKENFNMEEASGITPYYIRNPDVVLREEDEDGGLLFNPDTNNVKVINPTGLFIWQRCDGTQSLDEIVTALVEACEDAPADEVAGDVREFAQDMKATGFLGIPEDYKSESGQ